MNTKTIIRIEHPSDGKGLWCSMKSEGYSTIDDHSNYAEIVKRHRTPLFPNFWDDETLSESIDDSVKIVVSVTRSRVYPSEQKLNK